VLSELVTNCVQHAGLGADGVIEVSASLPGPALALEVWSRGPGFEAPASAAPTEENGRGLMLVDALTSAWGIARDGRQTGVWCDFGLQPA